MFNLGISEIFVIAFVALIVVGPEKLPTLARTLGKNLGKMRQSVEEIKRNLHIDKAELAIKEGIRETQNEIKSLKTSFSIESQDDEQNKP